MNDNSPSPGQTHSQSARHFYVLPNNPNIIITDKTRHRMKYEYYYLLRDALTRTLVSDSVCLLATFFLGRFFSVGSWYFLFLPECGALILLLKYGISKIDSSDHERERRKTKAATNCNATSVEQINRLNEPVQAAAAAITLKPNAIKPWIVQHT